MTIKQIIAVRTDLNMSRGKIAGQVAHAAMEFLRETITELDHRHGVELSATEREWLFGDRTKIVVQGGNETSLLDLHCRALARGLQAHVIRDLGKTEVEAGTTTALAIGPAHDYDLVELTGHLRLL
jgi:PTH2 family peptidyl-tRNA hydrolase